MINLPIYKPTKKGYTDGEYDENDRLFFLENKAIIYDFHHNEIIGLDSLAKRDSYWELTLENLPIEFSMQRNHFLTIEDINTLKLLGRYGIKVNLNNRNL